MSSRDLASKVRIFLLILGVTVGKWALASSFLVSSDEDYFVTKDGNYTYIFTKADSSYIGSLIEQNRAFTKLYELEFNWQFDETPHLILASRRNQIMNGFATTLPLLHTVFYDGGAAGVDDFAGSSWMFTLLSHETSHLYQTNPKKSAYSRFLKAVLGNANPLPTIIPLPPFPYMITPNLFLPTYALEGNAVLNESRFGNGGRLYSGQTRALFLNLLAAGKVTPKRLFNDHLDWPFTQEKYIVGGYLNLNLAEKHGFDTVNTFFWNNSDHFVNPFQLDRSFRENYGYSYEDAFANLKKTYWALAQKIVRVPGKSFAHSLDHGDFNRSKQKVLFITSDGKTRPHFIQVHADEKISDDKMNIPFGKAFVVNNEVYVPTAQTVSSNQIRYGLFGQGMKSLPLFFDKYVYDIQDKKTIYADVPKSFVTTQLYYEGKFIDAVQSSALFTPQGSIVYFKQNGNIRELYLNDLKGSVRQLTSFQGYYGKPVDITSSGDIYFTGATASGSSLFRLRSGSKQIERVMNADTIVDAKFLSSEKLVVAEISDTGYDYKIAGLDAPRAENPEYYKYFFENQETAKFYQPVSQFNAPTNIQPYSSIGQMKFQSIDLMNIGYSSFFGPMGTIAAQFGDPLDYQNILFGYSRTLGGANQGMASYSNSKYLLNFELGVDYNEDVVFTDTTQEKVQDRFGTIESFARAKLPLYTRSQMKADISTTYTYTYESTSPLYDSFIQHQHSLLTQTQFTRMLGYSQEYDANSYQHVLLAQEMVSDTEFKHQNSRYVGKVDLSEDVFWENFISAGYHAVVSESRFGDIKISDNQNGLIPLSPTSPSRFTPDTSRRYVQVNKVSAGYKKAISVRAYFASFPVSVRRVAPFAAYQEFYGARNRGDKLITLFHEWSYGMEIELLLFHKFPLRFVANQAEMNKRKGSTLNMVLNTALEF